MPINSHLCREVSRKKRGVLISTGEVCVRMEANAELAGRILELVGVKENVCSAANCMTRLRTPDK